MKKVLFILGSLVLIIAYSCGNDQPRKEVDEISGKSLFERHCAICHGEDGRKGFADAKILPESELDLKQRIVLITNGKKSMMPYRGILSEDEIEAVAEYTLTFK